MAVDSMKVIDALMDGAFGRTPDEEPAGDIPTALETVGGDVRVLIDGSDLALLQESDGQLVVLNGRGGSGIESHEVYRLTSEESASVRAVLEGSTE